MKSINGLQPIAIGLLAMLFAVGCTQLGATKASEPGAVPAPKHVFQESLRICRFWHGGSHDRKVSPKNPVIAGCLMRMGWSPDGVRADLLERTVEPAALQ